MYDGGGSAVGAHGQQPPPSLFPFSSPAAPIVSCVRAVEAAANVECLTAKWAGGQVESTVTLFDMIRTKKDELYTFQIPRASLLQELTAQGHHPLLLSPHH
eukprot:977251-Rhodomonas_salina.4